MADEQNSGKKTGGGGGSLGDLVKAESMIQLAITLPLACVIGWLIGAALDKHFHQGWIGVTGILVGARGRVPADFQDGVGVSEEGR